MKSKIVFIIFCAIMVFTQFIFAQDDVTVIVPTTEAGENLDLQAVMELFKEAETIEDFENALNDSSNEVNNLDLNGDGNVDYIRVVEHAEENVHVLVLQVPLAENEFQDVASIQIEKKSDEDYVLQAVGNEEIYGEDYVVEPEPSSTTVEVHIHTWPIIGFIWRPGRGLWISPWRWRVYPVWWRPWRPHPISIYRSRVVIWHKATFRHTRSKRSVKANNVYRTQRKSSTLAKQKTRKNTYTTQPVKQDPKKKQTTTKKQTQQKKKKQQQQPTKKKR